MYKQTILSLCASLLLTATTYSSDKDERHQGAPLSEAGGAATLSSSSSSSSSRTLDHQLSSSPLEPIVDLNDVLGVNNYLLAKYQPYVQTGFKAPDPSLLDPDFFAFLDANRPALRELVDPANLEIFSSFLLPVGVGLAVDDYDNKRYFDGLARDRRVIFLTFVSKISRDQLVFDAEKGANPLTMAAIPEYWGVHNIPTSDHKLPITDQLRKNMKIDDAALGEEDFDFKFKALLIKLSGWFNIMRKVYDYEIGVWAKEAPIMAGLLADYKAAMTRLTAGDGQFFILVSS